MATTGTDHVPDYPPRTPPPPKRPPSPWPPDRDPKPAKGAAVASRPRPALRVRNRQTATKVLEAAPWSVRKAQAWASEQVRLWGYRPPETLGKALGILAGAAVRDGGRRISVHLADQNGQLLCLVLSHQPGLAVVEDPVLLEVAALGVASCGTDTAADGRRRWVVIDL